MAKRGNNIYKRKDGRYEGRVPVGYLENGKRKYKSVYARTLGEVKEKMAQIYSVGRQQPSSKLKFQDAAGQWLVSARLRVKPSSYANYQNIVRKHLLPELGNFYLSALTSGKINSFILNKLHSGRLNGKGGLSAKSVRDIMTVFHSISVYAEREYGIHAVHFTMPKLEQKKMEVLNADERNRLVQHLLKNKNRTNIGILLCMFSGLRIGELCGLKWQDIDLQNNTISVNRTVQRINHSGFSEIMIGTPKSRSSVRMIPIPKFLSALLFEYREESGNEGGSGKSPVR